MLELLLVLSHRSSDFIFVRDDRLFVVAIVNFVISSLVQTMYDMSLQLGNSYLHVLLHPSLLFVLLSSQSSFVFLMPLPHMLRHTALFVQSVSKQSATPSISSSSPLLHISHQFHPPV